MGSFGFSGLVRARGRGASPELLLVGAYLAARVWQASGSVPLYTRDSVDYERIARLPLSSTFASEVKPWGLPLLYKLLPGELAIVAPIAQLLLSIGAWLVLATLWSATRDTNAYAFVPIALALVLSLRRRRRWLAVTLACGSVLILAGSAWSAASPRRWELVMIDLVDERVLASPDESAYFKSRGMPAPPDLRRRLFVARTPLTRFDRDPQLRSFRQWILRSGRRTYASYLLSHPHVALDQPLRRSGLLLSPVGLDFYKPRGFHDLLPQIVDRLIFLRSGRNVLIWVMLAAGVAGALSIVRSRRGPPLVWLLPAAAVLPLALLIWNSEPREVPRHELVPIVMSRLSLLTFCLLILDMADRKTLTSIKNARQLA